MGVVLFLEGDESTEVNLHDGQTILRAAKQGRVALRHKCGGNASCTTCKVKIADQLNISPPNKKEMIKLGEANIEQGFRLSCQTKVYGKVEAQIPEDPFRARVRQLLAEQKKGL